MANIKDKEMERSVLEFNLFNAKLQELEQQLQMIEKYISELQASSRALDELKENPKDQEMLAPIGQGIFVKSKLQDNKEVVLEIGSKIFAKKSVEEAQGFVDKKIIDFMAIREKVGEQIEIVLKNMQQIENKLRKGA